MLLFHVRCGGRQVYKDDCNPVLYKVDPCWEADLAAWDDEGGGGDLHSPSSMCETTKPSEHSSSAFGAGKNANRDVYLVHLQSRCLIWFGL